MKEPMLLKGGIIAGLFRACHAQCCWQCAFWGTGDRVAANQKPHQQPRSVLWKCKPPVPGDCRFTMGAALLCQLLFPQAPSQNDPTGLIRTFFWEIISAGNAAQSSQLPYGWTKLALFRRVWRNTTDFTSWKVLLYLWCSNSLQLWNPQMPQQTSTFLPCFHKNIFLVFPEILIHYLSKILWLFLKTWPAVFPSGSLLTIMSFSVHIQQDTSQLCAFQWLPNVH